MKQQTIKSTTGSILYQTKANSIIEALEQAVTDKVKLHKCNLTHMDLRNANLDDGDFTESNFTSSNLCGANISESMLHRCTFDDANMVDCCLAYSDLSQSTFKYTQFGATNITQAILDQCIFTGSSCLSLPFTTCQSMTHSLYIHNNNQSFIMNQAPIVIQGLHTVPIIILSNTILCGNYIAAQ